MTILVLWIWSDHLIETSTIAEYFHNLLHANVIILKRWRENFFINVNNNWVIVLTVPWWVQLSCQTNKKKTTTFLTCTVEHKTCHVDTARQLVRWQLKKRHKQTIYSMEGITDTVIFAVCIFVKLQQQKKNNSRLLTQLTATHLTPNQLPTFPHSTPLPEVLTHTYLAATLSTATHPTPN